MRVGVKLGPRANLADEICIYRHRGSGYSDAPFIRVKVSSRSSDRLQCVSSTIREKRSRSDRMSSVETLMNLLLFGRPTKLFEVLE